mgnify:FL=1
MEDFKELMAMIVGVTLIITIVVTPFAFLGYRLERKQCLTAYEAYTPSYTFWGGCKVEWSGKLTPVDIIREIK